MTAQRKVLVGDIMTEHVVTVHEDMSIKSLAHLLLRDRISGVPVVNSGNALCGIVTLSDLFNVLGDRILDREFGDYEHLFKNIVLSVGQIMSREVVTFSPDTPIEELIRISIFKAIHTFPIVENGAIVGIIGKRDILNAGFSYM